MRNYIRGLAFGLVVVVSLMVSKPAYALVNQTYPNFAGVTRAVARQDVWIVNATSWNAHIRSFTESPAYNIGTIGWTWWTFRDTCNGIIVDNWVKPGQVSYGANLKWDTGVDDRETCTNYRIWSLGRHDFKHGTSTWQPELSTNEPG